MTEKETKFRQLQPTTKKSSKVSVMAWCGLVNLRFACMESAILFKTSRSVILWDSHFQNRPDAFGLDIAKWYAWYVEVDDD